MSSQAATGSRRMASVRGHEPPIHIDTREDDNLYVLEGAITAYVGDEKIEVEAGSYAALPKNVPHGLTVRGDEVRLLVTLEPAGAEYFFVPRDDSDSDPAKFGLIIQAGQRGHGSRSRGAAAWRRPAEVCVRHHGAVTSPAARAGVAGFVETPRRQGIQAQERLSESMQEDDDRMPSGARTGRGTEPARTAHQYAASSTRPPGGRLPMQPSTSPPRKRRSGPSASRLPNAGTSSRPMPRSVWPTACGGFSTTTDQSGQNPMSMEQRRAGRDAVQGRPGDDRAHARGLRRSSAWPSGRVSGTPTSGRRGLVGAAATLDRNDPVFPGGRSL